MTTLLPKPLEDRRYSVHWGTHTTGDHLRYTVIVYDRLKGRIIYNANTRKLHKEFEEIIRCYGEDNCIPSNQKGQPIDLRKYLE